MVSMSICHSAQAPETIRYQSVIRDHNHAVIVDQQIGLHVIIARDVEASIVVYAESHNTTTGPSGMANIEIGAGSVESGIFTDIDWSSGPYYVKTGIDPEGGTSYSLEGAVQLLSVPYAYYAKTAGSVAGIAETQGLGDVLAVSDSAGGQIRNVTDPTDDLDAVTYLYFIQQLFQMGILQFSILSDLTADLDGNLYTGISIGNLVWMSENLRTTKFRDGTDIPLVTDQAEWLGLTTPAYCWYGNATGNSYSAGTCGALYNWYAVNTEKLCPAGWRVPTEEDWNDLITELGGPDFAGGKMKEAGTKHWMIPNVADNESGFSAIPGGYRSILFENIGSQGYWWSSTEIDAHNAGALGVANHVTVIHWFDDAIKKVGMSVRCVRDPGARILEPPF